MKKALRFLVVLLGALVASPGAWAVCTNTVTVKDGGGSPQTFCRGTDGTNMISSVNILDSAGTNFATVTASNALKVDSSAVTQPVSGTVTANQGGTWTVQPGNTANTTAWLVTGTGGTFPATQSGTWNVGQSGSWSNRILGNAGGVLDFAGQNAVAPANSLLTGCEFNTSPTTITSGNASPIQCTSAARLIVDGSQVTQPVSGTVTANAGTGTFGTKDAADMSGTVPGTAPGNTLIAGGIFNTTLPAPTTGQTLPFQLDASGRLIVSLGASSPTVTVAGTVTANAGTNLNTSALALDTSVNGILNSQGSTTSGEKGPLVQGAVTTSKPSYTTAQTDPLSLDTSGLLRVSLADTPANTNSFLVTATQSGNWTSRIVGNTGATLDATVAAGAAPTNGLAILGQYNTAVPAPTATQTVALQTNQNGYLLAEQGCAGQSVANTKTAHADTNSSATNLLVITGVASKQTYICAIDTVAGAATGVNLVEGTTTTNPCDTGAVSLMSGGATAARGWQFAANGGLTKGNGQGVLYKTATAADNVCLVVSAANEVTIEVTYAQF